MTREYLDLNSENLKEHLNFVNKRVDMGVLDLFEIACRCPTMFCETTNLRELLALFLGIIIGHSPPHGGGTEGFCWYVSAGFKKKALTSWASVFCEEFSAMDYAEAAEAIRALVHEWRASIGLPAYAEYPEFTGFERDKTPGETVIDRERLDVIKQQLDPGLLDLIEMFCHYKDMFGKPPNLRELLALLRGICVGHTPPRGDTCMLGFDEFVCQRFKIEPVASWTSVLSVELAGKEYVAAVATISALVHDWRAAIGMPADPDSHGYTGYKLIPNWAGWRRNRGHDKGDDSS